MTTPVLKIEQLRIKLPRGADRELAVSAIDLEVGAGELLCLVGESGSGKSVIAHATMGLLPKSLRVETGAIRLRSENLLALNPERLRALRGEQLAMIFQEPMTALNPVMSCGAQLDELLLRHTRLTRAERTARVLRMLAHIRLPDPQRMMDSYPHQLSGGQRQRIMIALALLLKPALLIADEPTTALDVTTQAEILRLIRTLQRESDTAVLFITHDFGVVAEIADRVAVLRLGEIVEQGPAAAILRNPQHPYTRMLLAAVPSLKPAGRAGRATAPIVLATENLGKTYARHWFKRGQPVRAAAGVSLQIRRGQTLGIVGESGSGKSTVARCIARLIEPDTGQVALHGASILALRGRAQRELRRKVQIVFQDPYRSLNPRLTVGKAITEGPLNFGVPRAEAWQRARALMELVHLSPHALERYPHEFSGGQRQRICIARALACEPELLIADEPVSALDVSVQAQILKLLDEIQQRLQLALLFITHDLRVAAQVCDRILVMQHGVVVEEGAVADVYRAPRHPYTQALLAAAPGRDFEFGGTPTA